MFEASSSLRHGDVGGRADSTAGRRRRSRSSAAAASLCLLLASCGGSEDGPATGRFTGSVVKGPVTAGRVCARPIADGRAQSSSAICSAISSTGAFELQVPAGSGDYLIEASEVRYQDESAGGAPADLDGMLTTVARAPDAGGTVSVAITAFTQVAYEAMRFKALPLSAATHAAEWQRFETVFGLSSAELSAPPVFDASAQPRNASAAAMASISVYARSKMLPVGGVLSDFGAAMARTEADADLIALNEGLIPAAAATFSGAGLSSRPVRVYGYGATFDHALPVDTNRLCQMSATGVDTVVFNPTRITGVRYTICIQSLPADGVCGESLQRALDYSLLPTTSGNASLSIVLGRAVAAFRTELTRYHYAYSLSCDASPTFRTYYMNGQLFPL
jgi:hypothetical protein